MGGGGFQFTLPRGERLKPRHLRRQDDRRFNSRSRVGSDPRPRREGPQRRQTRFNSRSRGGSDLVPVDEQVVHKRVSIHAPAGGATG